MQITKSSIYSHLLVSSSLFFTNIPASNATQPVANITMTPGHSISIHQNPSPSYLLAMADNLLITAQNELQFDLIIDVLRQAATKGSADAQFKLANLYLESEYVEYSEEKAMYWLEKAIAQNHTHARFVYEQVLNNGFDIGC